MFETTVSEVITHVTRTLSADGSFSSRSSRRSRAACGCGCGAGSSRSARWPSRTPPTPCRIRETTLEDLTWLQQEIVDAGGGALLLRAQRSRDPRTRRSCSCSETSGTRTIGSSPTRSPCFTDSLRHDKHLGPEVLLGAERTLRQFGASGWRRSGRSTSSARRAPRWCGRGPADGTTAMEQRRGTARRRCRPSSHAGTAPWTTLGYPRRRLRGSAGVCLDAPTLRGPAKPGSRSSVRVSPPGGGHPV